MAEEIPYPVRLNRYLALRGIATRKAADTLIAAGKVLINGQPAVLGTKVTADDTVEVKKSGRERQHRYFAYYKPRGIITHSPERGEKGIADVFDVKGVFPVGRLDKASEGLIILTDDGRITERLLHPRFVHEKEYEVLVQEEVKPGIEEKFLAGIESDGDMLRAKRVTRHGRSELTVVLTEGKKHQIRRMLDACHLTVKGLQRTRILNIGLGNLAPGEARVLAGPELETFLKDIGLADAADTIRY